MPPPALGSIPVMSDLHGTLCHGEDGSPTLVYSQGVWVRPRTVGGNIVRHPVVSCLYSPSRHSLQVDTGTKGSDLLRVDSGRTGEERWGRVTSPLKVYAGTEKRDILDVRCRNRWRCRNINSIIMIPK